jgi:glyoxylase-like metal-dependent hydrolase (beta-lactamase superfamily II)
MMQITRDIFQVGGGRLSSSEDAAIYLIRFGDHAALVDAGCGSSVKKVVSNIRALHVPLEHIEYLLLTHCHFDHTGGAAALREMTGCRIVAHELDAAFLEEGDSETTAASWYGRTLKPFSIDRKISGDREEIRLGESVIEAIHTPGHSPGSVVYMTESDGLRILFAQDVHGPIHPSLLSNRKDYLKSLKLLLSLEVDILCEGHYGVYRGREEVTEFIRGFLDSR